MSPSIDSVKRVCAANGFSFKKIEQVRKRVYRGTLVDRRLGSSRNVYIKLHNKQAKTRFEQFAQLASEVGHPPVQLIDGDQLCLLMGTAEGRPLSRLLPVVMVPGVWKLYGDQMVEAYFDIGTQIGVLHTKTQSGTGPLLSNEQLTTALRRVELLSTRLNPELVERTKRVLSEVGDQQTSHALTYGDRSPHNIYWNNGSVTHIDATCKRRSIVADHVSVLLGVHLMAERLPYARTHTRKKLEEAYWDGYTETGIKSSVAPELCAVRYIKRALALLSYYDSQPRSLNTRLTRRIDPPIVIREVQRVVTELSHL